jgi:hypothetical protein
LWERKGVRKDRRGEKEREKEEILPKPALSQVHVLQSWHALQHVSDQFRGGFVDSISGKIERLEFDDAQGWAHDSEVQVAIAEHEALQCVVTVMQVLLVENNPNL